jgi:hypothetical protein
VSRPCLARPIRRPLPRSLWGGTADAPGTVAVLETPRGCAAFSQRRAAGRGSPRALLAVAHARRLRTCARGSRQGPSPACGVHAYDARRRHATVDRRWPGGWRLAGLTCLWHGWRPWCAPWARYPSCSLPSCVPHNRLARTGVHTLSSAVPRGDTSSGRMSLVPGAWWWCRSAHDDRCPALSTRTCSPRSARMALVSTSGAGPSWRPRPCSSRGARSVPASRCARRSPARPALPHGGAATR